MDLSKQLIHQLAQARKALSKAKNNHYSDKRKQAYQVSLFSLLDAISESIKQKSSFSDNELFQYKAEIDFVFKSLEFLDNSVINLIPFEIVACLNKALLEWMDNDDKYIIVTSLNNNIDHFSFDPTLAVNDLQYQVFQNSYGVNFENRLVQFNIPKAFSRDYLISGVYYHELGHFIDTKNWITDSMNRLLINNFINNAFSPIEKTELLSFLPTLAHIDPATVQLPIIRQTLSTDFPHHIRMHLAEYFCDLFAAQYIGSSLQDHLLYITHRAGGGPTHPTSINRNLMVTTFLQGSRNIVINLINEALQTILNGKILEIKFEIVNPTDIYNFLPVVVTNDAQLHGIFVMGREVWNSDWTEFRHNMQLTTDPEPDKIYTILNNLIEKSIGNFIITEKWNQQRP